MNRFQNRFTADDFRDETHTGPLFQGMRHDPSVPLVGFAARDFSPAIKPWVQDEPCGYVDGLNAYTATGAQQHNNATFIADSVNQKEIDDDNRRKSSNS